MTSVLGAAGVTVASLFPIMNPIGALPAFVGMTAGERPAARRRQAVRGALYAGAILVVFAVGGRALLHGLGIQLPALQIAGGLIVGHAAYGMVVDSPRLTEREHAAGTAKADISFTPLAMPLLVGPGAIGVVLGLAGRAKGVPPVLGIAIGCVAMALVVGLVLRIGEPLMERLGESTISAMTKIFGFLILAIAVELVAHGLLALAPGLR
jgi:multiple antibiotic resistance protein